MTPMENYRIETPTAVGMIRVSEGVIISADLVFRRFWGRLFSNVEEWASNHGYKLEKMPPEKE